MTKKERLILINQYEILAALRPNDADHYKELIKILSEGYTIFYSSLEDGIDEEMRDADGRFVLDVLGLYRAIEDFKRHNKSTSVTSHHMSHFRGFDGNNEGAYLAFTRFLIEDQNKFEEQKPYFAKNDHLNSHMPMVGKYQDMLQTWATIGRTFELTEAQVLTILEA